MKKQPSGCLLQALTNARLRAVSPVESPPAASAPTAIRRASLQAHASESNTTQKRVKKGKARKPLKKKPSGCLLEAARSSCVISGADGSIADCTTRLVLIRCRRWFE